LPLGGERDASLALLGGEYDGDLALAGEGFALIADFNEALPLDGERDDSLVLPLLGGDLEAEELAALCIR
jgi:hypothetical protein